MDEKEMRGADAQLENEGSSVATQSEAEELNEEALHDDEDPRQALLETAAELGLNPDDLVLMTKAELQSYVDRAVTKAIKTREEKLKRKAEIEKMKEKGQWEQLLRQERAEALEDLKKTYMKAKGLPEEFADLVDTAPLLDKSLAEAKEGLIEKIDTIAAKINEIIEAKVNERLKALESGTFTKPEESAPPLPENPTEALRQLFRKHKA